MCVSELGLGVWSVTLRSLVSLSQAGAVWRREGGGCKFQRRGVAFRVVARCIFLGWEVRPVAARSLYPFGHSCGSWFLTLPRFGCSRFSRLFLVDCVPGAHSLRKRRLLLSSFRHLSGLGLSAVFAHDLLEAVVTLFLVAATGVDLDDKVDCSGALSLFCASSTPGGPYSSRPEIHRTVLRGSSRFAVETVKSQRKLLVRQKGLNGFLLETQWQKHVELHDLQEKSQAAAVTSRRELQDALEAADITRRDLAAARNAQQIAEDGLKKQKTDSEQVCGYSLVTRERLELRQSVSLWFHFGFQRSSN